MLKIIENDFLYSKKKVVFNQEKFDRRFNSSNTAANTMEPNLTERITRFATQLQSHYIYRISLGYLCDLGNINVPVKIGLKICSTLQTEMRKLFETIKKVTTIGAANTQIILAKAPFIQQEQFLIAKSFRQYFKTILLSSKVLRMGI